MPRGKFGYTASRSLPMRTDEFSLGVGQRFFFFAGFGFDFGCGVGFFADDF